MPEERFEARESRGKMILGLLMCCAFVAVGVVMVWDLGWVPGAAGALGVLVFGVGAAEFLRRIVRPPRVVLVFDRAGFRDARLFEATVPWSGVESADVVTIKRTRFISIVLLEPGLYPRRRLAGLNRSMGFGDVNIGLSFLDRPAQETIEAFFLRLDAYAGPPPG